MTDDDKKWWCDILRMSWIRKVIEMRSDETISKTSNCWCTEKLLIHKDWNVGGRAHNEQRVLRLRFTCYVFLTLVIAYENCSHMFLLVRVVECVSEDALCYRFGLSRHELFGISILLVSTSVWITKQAVLCQSDNYTVEYTSVNVQVCRYNILIPTCKLVWFF